MSKPGIYRTGREALLFLGGAAVVSILVTYAVAAFCLGLGRLTIALFGL